MKNYTDLNIILDRSGSMASIAKDMVGGITEFLNKEKESGDDTKVSLFTFDDKYDTVYVDKDIKDSPYVNLLPRGSTALLDAVGKTIVTVGEKLTNLKEEDRPNRVLFMIITDGAENCSKEYTFDTIKELIKQQREVYAWDFSFLGTNEDNVFAQRASLGVNAGSSSAFTRSKKGIDSTLCSFHEGYQQYKTLDRSKEETRSATFCMVQPASETEPTL